MTTRSNIKETFHRIMPWAIAMLVSLSFTVLTLHFRMPSLVHRCKLFAIFMAADIYLWFKIKEALTQRKAHSWWITTLSPIFHWSNFIIFMSMIVIMFVKSNDRNSSPLFYTVWGISTMIYLAKTMLAFMLLIYNLFVFIRQKKKTDFDPKLTRHTLAIIAYYTLICGIIMIWSIIFTPHHIQVREICLESTHPVFKDNDLTIVQFSDIHLGTIINPADIQKTVEMINRQNADIIVFTGDIIQSSANEILPYKNILAKLHAPSGIFSVMGNHDYATYSSLHTKEEQQQEIAVIEKMHQEMGWTLLRNESRRIVWHTDTLTIVGIDYWCTDKDVLFNYGDIDKSFRQVHDDYTIFLSHNPEIWDTVTVRPLPADITLSGHTHGMQLGIRTDRIRLSPGILAFQQWAGLYTNSDNAEQHLHINVGIASTGVPARIGIRPEITVIRIKGKK